MEAEMKMHETATLAGGCFWCTEYDFRQTPGIIKVVSGYTGGHSPQPTYESVCSGKTGHMEAVQVQFDIQVIDYKGVLDLYWRMVDPTDASGQFVDRGSQYRTAIFYHDHQQKRIALQSREKLQLTGRFDKPIITEILPLVVFYPAEAYHQEYYKKNPLRYKFYRANSGRDQFLKHVWKPRVDPESDANI